MKLALLLDVDGTLTPPRETVPPEVAESLRRLLVPFYVAAGSDLPLVKEQFLEPLWNYGFRGVLDAFVSNGSARVRCTYGSALEYRILDDFNFRGHLSEPGYETLIGILTAVLALPEFRLPAPIRVIGPQVVDRGSMLNFAPAGRPPGSLTAEVRENRQRFVAFDRQTGYRTRMCAVLREALGGLAKESGLVVMIGGETSFDLVVAGQEKTKPVRLLLAEGFERIVFLGDALSGAGNDSVIREYVGGWMGEGPCPLEAIEVKDWRDTLGIFRERGWTRT